MEKRKAAFNLASPKEKSDLFRTHLALYLAKHPELNDGQQRVILEGLSLLTPALYEMRTDNPEAKSKVDDSLRQFRTHILAAFTMEEGRNIFAALGDPEAPDDLLQRYKDISALPMKERKEAFRTVSPDNKSTLWRTHLALCLAKNADLTEDQKQIILDAMSLATPACYDSKSDRARFEEPLRLLKARILTAFAREEGAKIFATLGDPEPSKSGVVVSKNSTRGESASPFGNRATTARFVGEKRRGESVESGDCTCARQDDWCGIGTHCGSDFCVVSSWGCGTLWSMSCNGKCFQNLIE